MDIQTATIVITGIDVLASYTTDIENGDENATHTTSD